MVGLSPLLNPGIVTWVSNLKKSCQIFVEPLRFRRWPVSRLFERISPNHPQILNNPLENPSQLSGPTNLTANHKVDFG